MNAAATPLPSTAQGPALTGPDRGTPTTVAAPEAARHDIVNTPPADARGKQNDPLFSKPVLPGSSGLISPDPAAETKTEQPKIEANDSTVMPKEELDKAVKAKNASDDTQGVPLWLRDKVPFFATTFASLMHLATALGRMKAFFPAPVQKFLERFSLPVSKAANAFNYLMKSINSWKNNKGFDALGRLIHVLFVPFAKLEDIFLVGGLSSGLTQMWIAVNRDSSKDKEPKSVIEDIQYHFKRVGQLIKELIKPGALFGKNSLLWRNLRDEHGAPHLLVLTGIGNILSPVIGVGTRLLGLPSGVVSVARKFAAVLRNVMSILSDIGKYLDPYPLTKAVGGAYLGVSALDISQSFIKDPELKTTVNHFLQPVTNFANYLYAMLSSKKSDEANERKKNGGVNPVPDQKQIHKPTADNEMAFAA